MNRKQIPTTYTEAREALKGRASRTIANNTFLARDGEDIALYLHRTPVVTFKADGSIVLNTGGWHTVTTKDRLNRVARAHGWNLYADKRVWYVAHRSGAKFEFEDGFTIPPPAPKTPDAREWKDGEAGYCLGLVRSRGNGSVPRGAVESYLKVQVASASRDGAHTIAADLARAAFYIGQDKWSEAERVLAGCPADARESSTGPDVLVQDQGTIWLFRPETESARRWLLEHVDPNATWWGGALVADHRPARDLLAGIREAGFTVGAA